MFRDKDWKQKRKRGEPYEDPRKKYTPQEAHTGIGGGGVVGSVASAHILQNLKDAAKGINERSMDPREQVSDLPCNIRREGGQSLVIGGSSLVILEGKACNPL